MNISLRHRSFVVLIVGTVATTGAGILPTLRLGFWLFPHWLAFGGYCLMGIAVAIARTETEDRGLFAGAVTMALLSTLLALDVPFLLLDLPLSLAQGANHGLVLRYLLPLLTLAIGIPSFLIVLGRRVVRHDDRIA